MIQKTLVKEDLNDFLSKYYHKNFISYLGEYSWDCYQDERCFTPLLDEINVHYLTIMHYLFSNKEAENPLFFFILDASDAYKPFSHLISEKNFSFFLRKLFQELLVFPDPWNREGVLDFLFFPNKEEYDFFFSEKEEWAPKDHKLFEKVYSEKLAFLDKMKKNYVKPPNEEPFTQKIEDLESYLLKGVEGNE